MIERILRHVWTWDPFRPLLAPPDEEDWPDYSQIPLTYYRVVEIA